MNVLVAFDSFKDSLSAGQACAITARTLAEVHPAWHIETAPLTDGGEGFCRILTEARGGRMGEITVHGPRFRKVPAAYGTVALESLDRNLTEWLRLPPVGTLTIIEMAAASGLQMLAMPDRDLWNTSSIGTGELILEATHQRVDAILLGVGGSATNDLGLGALEALGVTCQGTDGATMYRTVPADWDRVAALDVPLAPDIPSLRIACDVHNPLLGKNGAAAIYGPQKGLKSTDWRRLDRLCAQVAGQLCAAFDADHALIEEPGSGAAGGISFGLKVACGAQLASGIELVKRWLCLDEKLARADLIITGEGRFDPSSLQGKGPGTLIDDAAHRKTKVKVFAGQVVGNFSTRLPAHMGMTDLIAISPPGVEPSRACSDAPALLARAVARELG